MTGFFIRNLFSQWELVLVCTLITRSIDNTINQTTTQTGFFLFFTFPFMVFIHLGLVLADDEPEPVHGDRDHSQGGHEGRQTGNCACQSEKSDKSVYYLPYIILSNI